MIAIIRSEVFLGKTASKKIDCAGARATLLQFATIVWLLAAMTTFGADRIGVILNGTCDYVVRPENKTPMYSAHYKFEVSLSGPLWIIAYEDTSAPTNADVLNVKGIASCDGTNIYSVQFQNERAVKKAWGNRFDSVKDQLPRAQAEIYPGSYPPPNPIVLQQLWFAFASSGVFTGSSGKAKPPAFVDLAIFYSTNFECAYYWTNTGATRQITLKSDGRILGRDLNTGQIKYLTKPPYTSGVGFWDRGTNILGVFVPRECEYNEFAPQGAEQNSRGLLKTWAFRCKVTDVRTAVIDQIPTKLPAGRILFTDRRFLKEGYSKVNYISTNAWIATNDSYITSQLLNRPKMSLEEEFAGTLGHPAPHSGATPIRYLMWIVMALPVLYLLGKGLFNKLNKQRKE